MVAAIYLRDVNANCTNTNGSHKCTCKEGHTGGWTVMPRYNRLIQTNFGIWWDLIDLESKQVFVYIKVFLVKNLC